MKRISLKERRRATLELLNDQLFCDMHQTLTEIGDEYNNLSAPEVWGEAKSYLQDYCKNTHPSDTLALLTEEMEERYGTFEENGNRKLRTEDDVRLSIFLVMGTMLFMLCAESKDKDGSQYREHCQELAKATLNHPLRERFTERIKEKEDLEEKAGRRVGVVNYLLEEVSHDFNNDAEIQQAQEDILHKLLDVVLDMDENSIAAHERSFGRLSRQLNHRFENHLERLAEKSKERVDQSGGDTYYGDRNEFHEGSSINQFPLPPGMTPQEAMKLLQNKTKDDGKERYYKG